MSKKKTIESEIQSKIDNMEEACNSKSGYKNTMSSGTRGSGASLSRNQR